jgi:hypothetical protein
VCAGWVGWEAIELLDNLLVFDPDSRYTVEQSLQVNLSPSIRAPAYALVLEQAARQMLT